MPTGSNNYYGEYKPAIVSPVKTPSCTGKEETWGNCDESGFREHVEIFSSLDKGRCIKKTTSRQVHCPGAKPNRCKCSALGDPHYRGYDGQVLHFFGDCRYTLTKYSKLGDQCAFNIEVDNNYRGKNSYFTYTKDVIIDMFNSRFVLDEGEKVQVDGVQVTLPYNKGQVKIFLKHRRVHFVAEKCDVHVAFDGYTNAVVEVSKTYGGSMTGICGSCNGNKNEYLTSKGQDVSKQTNRATLIGNSYQVSVPNRKCQPAKELDIKDVCDEKWIKTIKSDRYCGAIIKPDGPFAQCGVKGGVKLQDFYDDCIFDLCGSVNDTEYLNKLRCDTYDDVATACEDWKVKWRKTTNCPLHCPAHSHFTDKAKPCPKTCENHFYGYKDPCYEEMEREDCECDEGYLLDGSLCVKPTDCKCLDLCIDREDPDKCAKWKKSGRCKDFKKEMTEMCAKTCSFCTPQSKNDCEDELSTWKCLQFRNEGLCTDSFYQAVCSLTCNYEKCSCDKDEVHEGPCDEMKRTKVITYVHYERDSNGPCVKLLDQKEVVCNCKFHAIDTPGQCNYCTGQMNVTTNIQEEINGTCVNRDKVTQTKCLTCPENLKVVETCTDDNVKVQTKTYQHTDGCYKCIPETKTNSTTIECKNDEIVGPCDKTTCMKTITTINRYPKNCTCVEEKSQSSQVCGCCKSTTNLKPYCDRDTMVYPVLTYSFDGKTCQEKETSTTKVINCTAPEDITGTCKESNQYPWVAIDVIYSANIDENCMCKISKKTDVRICKCKPPETNDVCDREAGIQTTVTTSYNLEFKDGKYTCEKSEKKNSTNINFVRQQYVDETPCGTDCYKRVTTYYTYRDGCEIKNKTDNVNGDIADCCCTNGNETVQECQCDVLLKNTSYYYVFTDGVCVRTIADITTTAVTCPAPHEIQGSCILPNNKREIKKVSYTISNCTCVEKVERTTEPCPCEYIEFNVDTVCDNSTCQATTITTYQDTDCYNKTISSTSTCCCKNLRTSTEKGCDKSTGRTYKTDIWYEFDTKTLQCVKKSKEIFSSVKCDKTVKRILGECGAEKSYYKKVTLTKKELSKEKCSCEDKVSYDWERCSCPEKKVFEWMCKGKFKTRTEEVYTLNPISKDCDRKEQETMLDVRCFRPRQDKRQNLSNCQYRITSYRNDIENCNCVERETHSDYYSCCPQKQTTETRCDRGTDLVTIETTYVLSDDKKSCKPSRNEKAHSVECSKPTKVTKSDCQNGLSTITTLYYEVVNCSCVEVKKSSKTVICECFPKVPQKSKVCLDKSWKTTVTSVNLVDGKCITAVDSNEEPIKCSQPKTEVGVCNMETGIQLTNFTSYDIHNCSCVPHVNITTKYCYCRKEFKTVRKECVKDSLKREVIVYTNKLVDGECSWIEFDKREEPCKCPTNKENTVCVEDHLWNTTVTRFELRLKEYKTIKLYECVKEETVSSSVVDCKPSYTVTGTCKNNQQAVTKYFYEKKNCKCVESSTVIDIKPCDCKDKDNCNTECIDNQSSRICYAYSEGAKECIFNKTITQTPIQCALKQTVESGCSIYKDNGIYKKITETFQIVENCKCVDRQYVRYELCTCNSTTIAPPVCINNQKVTVTTSYIQKNGLCIPDNTKYTTTIDCPLHSLKKEETDCYIKYKLTYYELVNCNCVKREKLETNSKCCSKKETGKKCQNDYWIFTEKTKIIKTTKVRLFPQYSDIFATTCEDDIKEFPKRVTCENPYSESFCNPTTKIYTTENNHWDVENCKCVKRVETTTSSCVDCPVGNTTTGPCLPMVGTEIRYSDVTVTYYELLKNNTCKKKEEHKKTICSCQPEKSQHECIKGEKVTTKTTYSIHSSPPCKPITTVSKETVSCYNNNKQNEWKTYKIDKCQFPGDITIYHNERQVYNSTSCACHRETHDEKMGICCPPCSKSKTCLKNVKYEVNLCYNPVGLKCVEDSSKQPIPVQCLPKQMKPISECDGRYQRFQTTSYKVVNCECVPDTKEVKLRCECPSEEQKVCVNNRWKIERTKFDLVNYECIPTKSTDYDSVVCPSNTKFENKNINDCKFNRATLVQQNVNCKCTWVVIKNETLDRKCCLTDSHNERCENNSVKVITSTTYQLYDFICKPSVKERKESVKCDHLRLEERIETGVCTYTVITYKVEYHNCECKRVEKSRVTKESCCEHKPPSSSTHCDKENGMNVTENIRYDLEGDVCVSVKKKESKRINCERKDCRKHEGPCSGKTKTTTLYCSTREGCRCVEKPVKEYKECCNANFTFSEEGECPKDENNFFKTITYYSHQMDTKSDSCKAVVVNKIQKRCKCPKANITKSCYNDQYTKTTTVTYTLEGDSCMKHTDDKITPITVAGCKTDVSEECNSQTGYGTRTFKNRVVKDCKCQETIKTERFICICHKVFPPDTKNYCKDDHIYVTETRTGDCKGNEGKYTVETKKTSINCDRIEYVESECYTYMKNFALTAKTIKKIRHYAHDCKCEQEVVHEEIKHCKCEQDKQLKECVGNSQKITSISYLLVDGKCTPKETYSTTAIPCPKEPKVTKSECENGHYTLSTKTFAVDNCQCKSSTHTKQCDCDCPKPKVSKECSKNYVFNIITKTYDMRDCQCVENKTVTQEYPKCPTFVAEEIGECDKKSDVGYQTIIRRKLSNNKAACTCTVDEFKDKKVCHCNETKTVETKCINDKIKETVTMSKRPNWNKNNCELVEVSRNQTSVVCPPEAVKSECNKETGKATETTTFFTIKKCSCFEDKKVTNYDCNCTKTWKLTEEGKCSGPPRCEREDKYIGKELQGRKCVDVKHTKKVKCCCFPPKDDKSGCSNNVLTITNTTYNLKNNVCVPETHTKSETVACPLDTKCTSGECKNGKKLITCFGYQSRNCSCIKVEVSVNECDCVCPPKKTTHSCDLVNGEILETTTSYEVLNCKCTAKVDTKRTKVSCPNKQTSTTKCIPLPKKETFIQNKITTTYELNKDCQCVGRNSSEEQPCGCDTKTSYNSYCNKTNNEIVTTTTITEFIFNQCRNKTSRKSDPVNCGCTCHNWKVASISECQAVGEFGTRTILYTKTYLDECKCKDLNRTVTCDCPSRCTGKEKSTICVNNKQIKTTSYSYNMDKDNCHCHKTEDYKYKHVECNKGQPVVSECKDFGDGMQKKSITYTDFDVVDCECKARSRVEWIICKCPDSKHDERCDTLTNRIVKTNTWYTLESNTCKKKTDTVQNPIACDLTPVCKQVSVCNTGSNTQTYECTVPYGENCKCQTRKKTETHPCECAPPDLTKGVCSRSSCLRDITTVKHVLRLNSQGQKVCTNVTDIKREACCCNIPPTTSSKCVDNKQIVEYGSYSFNETSLTCNKITKNVDETPLCSTGKQETKQCNKNTCELTVNTTTSRLIDCKCRKENVVSIRRCCCKDLPKTTTECRFNSDLITKTYTKKLVDENCVEIPQQETETVKCPKDIVKNFGCNKMTGRQIIHTTSYNVVNCKCNTTLTVQDLVCICPPPKTAKKCDARTGETVTTTIKYELDSTLNKCVEDSSETRIPADCQTKPSYEYSRCQFNHNNGTYKQRTKKYEERVGCSCIPRTETDYVLCECGEDDESNDCQNDNQAVTTTSFYTKVKSDNPKYDMVCIWKQRTAKVTVPPCQKSIFDESECIDNFKTITEKSWIHVNCECVSKPKVYTRRCSCGKPSVVGENCESDIYKVTTTRSWKLVCNKDPIPKCECEPVDTNTTKTITCPDTNLILGECNPKTQKQEITNVHYDVAKCKCNQSTKKWIIDCSDECENKVPGNICTNLENLNVCNDTRTVYRYLCPLTCGFCEPCPKTTPSKKITDCTCRKIAGKEVCTEKYEVTRYVQKGRKCTKKEYVYEAPCDCVDRRPPEECKRFYDEGKCSTKEAKSNCGWSCNPTCRSCSGETYSKICVQNGEFKGKYEYLYLKFNEIGTFCSLNVTVTHEGKCETCDKSYKEVIKECVDGVRLINRHFVDIVGDKCVNNVTTRKASCADCCDSVETYIGDCQKGERTVTQTYWANVNGCCKKQTVTNVYTCNDKCLKVTTVESNCINNKKMSVRLWYSGPKCLAHSAHKLTTCAPTIQKKTNFLV